MATKLGLNPKWIQLIHPISLWIRSFKVKDYLVVVVDVRSDQQVLSLEQLKSGSKVANFMNKNARQMELYLDFKNCPLHKA